MIKKIIKKINALVLSPLEFAKKSGVEMGSNCSIHSKHFGSEPYLIKIGNDVQIAENVRFATHGGGWVFRRTLPNFDTFGKIVVGNNVYIGNSSIILPGVNIGNNVVIGAGSVVTKSLPDNGVYAGNPAKLICSTDQLKERLEIYNLNSFGCSAAEKKNILLKTPDDKFIKK